MYNDKDKEFINNVNEQYEKILNEEYGEDDVSEAKVKMTSVYITKNTAKIRKALMKWAKEHKIPALYSDPFHPGQAVSISSDHLEALTDKFDSSFLKQIGSEHEYMMKKNQLKAVGGATGKQTRGMAKGYKPTYDDMWA